ncbi:MAG: hypothetical protein ACKOAD_00420 [Gammaproteobacteria bacterium]
MLFNYNHEKNAWLLENRNIGFDEIIHSITQGNLLDIKENTNPKYPNQGLMYVRVIDEVYVVPFVIEAGGVLFLKTLFPSRKARKYYETKF